MRLAIKNISLDKQSLSIDLSQSFRKVTGIVDHAVLRPFTQPVNVLTATLFFTSRRNQNAHLPSDLRQALRETSLVM